MGCRAITILYGSYWCRCGPSADILASSLYGLWAEQNVASIAYPLIWPSFALIFRISERDSIMFSLAILLGGYLITYNWPFLSQTMPYAYSNTTMSLTSSNINSAHSDDISISNCGGRSDPGCPPHYIWCATTTRWARKWPIYPYNISFILNYTGQIWLSIWLLLS